MRKSSLKDFTSKKLLSHADVPAVIKAGGATCTDATIKGIRASIKEYARAGIISDKIATTYAVTSGRETRHSGLHYGNKEKMCTWLNCEDDKTVTGDGATALTHYTTPSFTKCMDRCRFVSMCSSRLQACFPRESMRRVKQ